MTDYLVLHHKDGTSTKVYPPKLWTPETITMQEVNKTLRSLPDQVHNWPPERNEHGFNRKQRRLAAKQEKKLQKAKERALTNTLNKAAAKARSDLAGK